MTQHYKTELTKEQKHRLKTLLKVQSHPMITPEIRRANPDPDPTLNPTPTPFPTPTPNPNPNFNLTLTLTLTRRELFSARNRGDPFVAPLAGTSLGDAHMTDM